MCGAIVTSSATIAGLLEVARSGMVRLDPEQAYRAAQAGNAIIVDTRPEWQRRADGEIPGAVIIERNHLEWRCDPASPARIPEATSRDVTWIVCCDEGFSSSLAAASLRAIGLSKATDLVGGFQAWRAAGLPVQRAVFPARPRLSPEAELAVGGMTGQG
jgi:rhodanese-related sulfurtransferase